MESLTKQLAEFCYKGDIRKGDSFAVDWIKLVVKEMGVRINFDFFGELRKKRDGQLNLRDIEHYIACAVPNIPSDIRYKKLCRPLSEGEDFCDVFFATDSIWEDYRKNNCKVPKGGITLSRNQ